jgi:hypothetical protein
MQEANSSNETSQLAETESGDDLPAGEAKKPINSPQAVGDHFP